MTTLTVSIAVGLACYVIGKAVGYEQGFWEGHNWGFQGGQKKAETELVYRVINAFDEPEDVRLDWTSEWLQRMNRG